MVHCFGTLRVGTFSNSLGECSTQWDVTAKETLVFARRRFGHRGHPSRRGSVGSIVGGMVQFPCYKYSSRLIVYIDSL